MRKIMLLATICAMIYVCSVAQTHMRVHHKNGGVSDFPIEQVDSITFVEKVDEASAASIVGGWLWGNREKGYYEVLTFKEDRTYIGYDYYMDYGFDTWTYGFYSEYGNILSLWSNGFGYQRRYSWFVTALTGNALEVVTRMGDFIYYRVQPEIYSLKVGEESHECLGGDYYVFTDGVKVSDNERKLKGIVEGASYILKYEAESDLIMAYKVIIER